MSLLEPLLIASAAGLASIPFAIGRGWPPARAAMAAGLAFAGAAVVSFGLAASGAFAPDVAEAEVTNRPRQIAEDGYASSDSCRACHPREYSTWHASYHRTMTQVADVDTVLGDFALRPTAESGGMTWSGERRGDELVATVREADGTTREARIVMTTGSHHMEVYWAETGADRRLQMAPFVWLVEEQRFITRDSAFLQAPTYHQQLTPGKWNTTCVMCHTTGGKPRILGREPEEIDTRAAEFGISCEACHGPSEDHVRAMRSPLARYAEHRSDTPPADVTHPERFDSVRSSEVCGQCHSVFVPQTDFSDFDEGRRFTPGDALEDAQHLVRGFDDEHPVVAQSVANRPDWHERHFWRDGMVRVSGREFTGLSSSPCYTHGDESAGILSCLDCHAMHQPEGDSRLRLEWANDQLKPGMETNDACISCHESYADDTALRAHTHHGTGSSGSLCYNCHMPHTTYGLLKAIRSHQIDSPDVKTFLSTGRPVACNQCHLDRTLAWTAEHLEDWYDIPAPPLDRDQRTISASVLSLIQGDAGQRALAAWTFGWETALEASGRDWPAAFLVLLLEDAYDAVRYIAYRSLRQHEGFRSLELDWLAPSQERMQVLMDSMREFYRRGLPGGAPDTVPIDDRGRLDTAELKRLGAKRDDRPMDLAE